MSYELADALNQAAYGLNRSNRRRRRTGSSGGLHGVQGRSHVVTDPVIVMAAMRANGRVKRTFDIVSSFCGLVILAPILLTVALLIWLNDGGSPLYGHKRVGRQGRPFQCWKFRSMVMNGDAVLAAHLAANPEAAKEWEETQKLTDDPRVTRIGAFIRKTSIDELPQLWNVLRGEMSVIGPRPITRKELDRYGKNRRYYLLVRPGITGLWQVSGRSSTTYERRVSLDRRYLENWSYEQDVMILLKTLPAVLKSEGAV
ncbi:MAG: sugar transferase [Hyphomonadaceae bacterium]|nr:sugar transferase [Hyphomonadaceae bacterium]